MRILVDYVYAHVFTKESSRNSLRTQKTSVDSTNVSVAIIQGRMASAQNESEATYWAQQMVQLQQVRGGGGVDSHPSL